MRIKTKFYLGALISICLIAVLILLLIILAVSISKQNEHMEISRETQKAVSELDILTYNYLIHHESRPKRQWHRRYISLGRSINDLKNYRIDEEEIKLTKQLSENYIILGKTFSNIETGYENRQKLIEEEAPQEEIDNSIHRENRLATQLLIASQSMINDSSTLADKDVKDLLNIVVMGRNVALFLTLILLTVTTFIAVSVIKTVAKSLDILQKGASEIGGGNLNYKIGVKSKDEIGVVANELNHMASNLKKVTTSRSFLKKEVEERKQMQEALKLLNERISSILNRISDGFFSVDNEWRFTYFNKAAQQILPTSTENLLGRKLWDVYPALIGTDLENKYRKAVREQQPISLKSTAITGKIYQVRCYPSSSGLSVHFTDITLQEDFMIRQSEFISIASHELKKPLTSLSLNVELLKNKMKNSSDKKLVNIVMNLSTQAALLRKLTTDVFDTSSIQTGQLKLKRESCDLDSLIKDVVKISQRVVFKHKIHIRGKVRSKVTIDKIRISQVITNLINNAVKYSPKADEVNVLVEKKEQEVVIGVQDFGIGIPKNKRVSIFGRFYRAESGKNLAGGLGLGLYISNNIITSHGGRMWVESELRKGSTFYFSLPLNS